MDMYQKLRTSNAYRSKAVNWMRVGDRGTKGFFEAVKCKGSGTQPSCLKKTNGTMTMCAEEMLEMATNYYMKLLNVCNEEHLEQAAFRNIINKIPKRVSAQMMDNLNTPICIQELWDAISYMNKQSCAGIDGLPIYFYIKYWDLIKDDMLEGMQYG